MSSSMPLGAVVGERAGGAAELVVERDAGGEGEQALADPGSEAVQGASAVAFERQEVFEGPEMVSMRWRIGARCGPQPGSLLRCGRTIRAWRSSIAAAKSRLA